jgi:hypothetical protein
MWWYKWQMWLKIGKGWGLVGVADSQGRELFVDISKIILHNVISILLRNSIIHKEETNLYFSDLF